MDVTFEEGRGWNTTAILVGQGGYDMGHLNVTNAVAAMARGVPLRVAGSQEQCVDYARGYIALTTPPGNAGWGRSTPEEWQKLVDTLVGVGEIKQAPAVGAIYTNSALP